ncbi:MAG: polyprenyl synthetase family protein [Thermoplasmata archaeon]|nr:MAG: polyprenyl synthetase family protein [Thermoplasmata archaeon]
MDLIERFADRIEEVNRQIDKLLRVREPENLYLAARHLVLAGGKRLRPLLSMLSTEIVGGEWKRAIPFSVALELMHNFTLIHDDIMDKASMRRGIETVHVKFGESTAIIAGDFLFAKSYEALHDLDVELMHFKRLNEILTRCIEEICEGQEMDMDFEKRERVSEEEYIEMINKKTAALFSCSAEGGAIIGGGSEEEIKRLAEYGRFLGLAFQIWDDYLDLKGEEREFGKRIGNDIREGKKTLMIIHALSRVDEDEKRIILSVLGKSDASDEEVRKVIDILDSVGSLKYSKEKALEFSRKAKELIRSFPESETRRYMEEFVDYCVIRKR